MINKWEDEIHTFISNVIATKVKEHHNRQPEIIINKIKQVLYCRVALSSK